MSNHQLPAEKHREVHQRWREYEELPQVQRQKLREGHQVTGKPGR
jgi:hypothetical protein